MRARTILLLLIILINIALLVLINLLLKEKTWLLIASEIAAILIMVLMIMMLQRTLRPVNIMKRGLDLLREEDFTTSLIETGYADVDELIKVFNRMIARLRKEKLTIREQNHFLDLLIKSTPSGLIITSTDGSIISVNSAAEKMFNMGKDMNTIINVSEIPLLSEIDVVNMKDRDRITFSKGNLKYVLQKDSYYNKGFNHPFYLLNELTNELREAEKRAYGKVIRMMAHEVNNTVGAVNSILSSVLSDKELPDDNGEDENTMILKVALARNEQLNRFMKRFSDVIKIPLPDRSRYELNDSVSAVVNLYSKLLSDKNIVLNLSMAEPSPYIFADRSQIEQVITNIIKNAAEAIGSDGEIRVISINSPPVLKIVDNGHGLDKKSMNKLFTPFYTTKTDGQGIGLTVVNEILVNHGFRFSLHPDEKGLTEFMIRFPG